MIFGMNIDGQESLESKKQFRVVVEQRVDVCSGRFWRNNSAHEVKDGLMEAFEYLRVVNQSLLDVSNVGESFLFQCISHD